MKIFLSFSSLKRSYKYFEILFFEIYYFRIRERFVTVLPKCHVVEPITLWCYNNECQSFIHCPPSHGKCLVTVKIYFLEESYMKFRRYTHHSTGLVLHHHGCIVD